MKTSWLTSLHRIIFVSSNRKVMSMCTLYMLYLCFGGLIFALLEQKGKSDRQLHVRLTSSVLMRDMVETLRNMNVSDDEIAASFAKQHYEWRRDPREFQTSWIDAYGQKVMFCMVLIATVGYGNIVPKTSWGKGAVIVYLVIGRPIQVTMMRLLGLQFRSGLRKVLKRAKELNMKLPEIFHQTKLVIYLAGALFFFVFTVAFIFGPAAIFERFEDWSYEEAVYFAFLSLATIGLGDYVAGVSSKHHDEYLYTIYVGLIFFWLMFGVAYVQMVMNLISYLYGLLILDQLDCKCANRRYARKKLSALYDLVAELNWKLTKYCPHEFVKARVFEDFLDLCVDRPEEITEETMRELYEASEELKNAAGKHLLQMILPDELKSEPSLIPSAGNLETEEGEQLETSESSISRFLRRHWSEARSRGAGRISLRQNEEPKPPIEKLEEDSVQPSEFEIKSDLPKVPTRSLINELLNKKLSKNFKDQLSLSDSEADGAETEQESSSVKTTDSGENGETVVRALNSSEVENSGKED